MPKKPSETISLRDWKLLDEKLDAFVRALAIEAARHDHREALKKAKQKKGGRSAKARLCPASALMGPKRFNRERRISGSL
ncbi:hypothetical protein [Mesorhizobium sp. Root552]|uniref:hypothetical protein n=1 Tax=Mesorhizobium sp. Root552 TaxID=1736555 RepID=UPI000A3EDFC7|nr:hypothetical protein [Mesorhizobium sp. Root552]